MLARGASNTKKVSIAFYCSMPRRSPKQQNSIPNPTAFDPSYDDHEQEKNFVLLDQTPWHWNSPLALPPQIHWICTVAPSTTSTWKSRWCNEHLASGWNGWWNSVYFLTRAMWDVKTMIKKIALQIVLVLSLASITGCFLITLTR